MSDLNLGTTGAVFGVTNGGTGLSSYTVGDLPYASGATTISKLADVATGNVLLSGGAATAPSYGKVGLTTHISGTLPVANGGTSETSYTDGQLLIGNSSGNTLTKATLTAGSGVSITNGGGSITISATASSPSVALPFVNGDFRGGFTSDGVNYVLCEGYWNRRSGGTTSSTYANSGYNTAFSGSSNPTYMNVSKQTLFSIADGTIRLRGYLKIPNFAGSATERWDLGLSDDGGTEAGTGTYYAAFIYTHSSQYITCKTTNGGSITTTTTSVLGRASSQTNVFDIVYASGSCAFYIDGTLVATHTTNLPTSSPILPRYSMYRTHATAVSSVLYYLRCAQ